MRSMAGGSYSRSLRSTFMSELLSMNCLMGGMIVVSTLAWKSAPEAHEPTQPLFWFRMSVALMVGFAVAYPMNWWLVANHLKHGMMTVRRNGSAKMDMGAMDMGQAAAGSGMAMGGMAHDHKTASQHALHPPLAVMTALSFLVLAAGLGIAWVFGGLSGGG